MSQCVLNVHMRNEITCDVNRLLIRGMEQRVQIGLLDQIRDAALNKGRVKDDSKEGTSCLLII